MGTILMDQWRGGSAATPIADSASITMVREQIRSEGAAIGMSAPVIEELAIIATELGQNQLVHSYRGWIAVRRIERDGTPGIELVAGDAGPGLHEPGPALEGTVSRKKGLGIGLSGARRLAHEIDVDVRRGEGTCVWARKFASPVVRRREIAILGRPAVGEPECGDHAGFVRSSDGLLIAVADGLGHGPAAKDAATLAVPAALADPLAGAAAALERSAAALADTRGAVVTVLRVDEKAGVVEHAGVGNIKTVIAEIRDTRSFTGSAGVLGGSGGRRSNVRPEQAPVTRIDVLIVATDGISSRAALPPGGEHLHRHPMITAELLLASFGKEHDDALVVVCR